MRCRGNHLRSLDEEAGFGMERVDRLLLEASVSVLLCVPSVSQDVVEVVCDHHTKTQVHSAKTYHHFAAW